MDEKRQLDELIALYSLEESIKDIYVEGNSDKYFLRWFLDHFGKKDINIYSIDFVDIPDEIIRKHKLTSGSNRSKIIALSQELSDQVTKPCNVLCIVDRDFEDFVPTIQQSRHLVMTDYNSMESYLLNDKTFHKYLTLVLSGFPITAGSLLKKIFPILESLFCIRLANELLRWNMSWVNIKKYISLDGNKIEFRKKAFVRAYLLRNAKLNDKEVFISKVNELHGILSDEIRFNVRGHDAIDLLYYLVKKLKKDRKIGDIQFFHGTVFGCLEFATIQKEGLFQTLSNF